MTLRSTDPLAESFATAREMLTQVGEDQLGEPTPCRSWDVHALINHMVGAPLFAVGRLSGNPTVTETDFAAGDFVVAHDETARLAVEAFSAPGALEKPIEFPGGTMPTASLMFFVASDQLAHAWDLARAVGSSTDLAPRLSTELLGEATEMVTDEMRGDDGKAPFGPEQPAPPGASPADRLAAFFGRSV
jgi:uncharacterized protein (TIGR03086 family)